MSDRAQHFFENQDLAELRLLFIRTCRSLGLDGPARAHIREHVANLIMQFACGGERDPSVIEQRVRFHLDTLTVLRPESRARAPAKAAELVTAI